MSELRQDLITGEWVIIATKRADRPHPVEKAKARKPSPKNTCPFEDLVKSGEWPPLLSYPGDEDWEVVVVPNKYPAVVRSSVCSEPLEHGIYRARTGVGNHDLLITRDHNQHFPELPERIAVRVFEMLQTFHQMADKDPCARYVASFCNFGAGTGASIWHPHYQIITLPVVPSHALHSMAGAREYLRETGRCVRCDIGKREVKERKRVVAENASMVAFVPYAAKTPYEVNIMPKKHEPSFRHASKEVVRDTTLILQKVLQKMKKHVNDPDYNFYLHDMPLSAQNYDFHHWHLEVIPKVTTLGGFELSTRININSVDPDDAARTLRGHAATESHA